MEMQDLAFSFVELYEISVGPFFQLAQVPLNGSTATRCVADFFQYFIL